jgi:putative ABC transport system permease protein
LTVLQIALKMLFNDRLKFVTLLAGITFAVLLITQQGSIFCGLMLRTGSTIFDTNVPIWVMDPNADALIENIPVSGAKLQMVRSVPGVAWAVPYFIGNVQSRWDNGSIVFFQLIGVDEQSLIGLPRKVLAGRLEDINQPEAIVMTAGKEERIGHAKVGSFLEINDHRARMVALIEGTKNFTFFPTVYTTYDKAIQFVPRQKRQLSYILVSPQAGVTVEALKRRIAQQTGLKAFDQWELFWANMLYTAKNTGIPISFGMTIALGLIIGAATAGQTLYTFVLDNNRQFGTFKAIGLTNGRLVMMVLTQSFVVGVLGYGIGIGLTSAIGLLVGPNGGLAFYTPWQLFAIAFVAVVGFALVAGLISIQRVLRVDPAIVFRG